MEARIEEVSASDLLEGKKMYEKPDELKPCPFCGGEAHLDRHDIFCDCGAKIEIPQYVGGKVSIAGYPTYEQAVQEMIETWNRRANDGT